MAASLSRSAASIWRWAVAAMRGLVQLEIHMKVVESLERAFTGDRIGFGSLEQILRIRAVRGESFAHTRRKVSRISIVKKWKPSIYGGFRFQMAELGKVVKIHRTESAKATAVRQLPRKLRDGRGAGVNRCSDSELNLRFCLPA